MNRLIPRLFSKLGLGLAGFLAAVTAVTSSSAAVYQYSVPVGARRAYLWIPPDCTRVRGIIVALSNLLERRWLEDPIIRQAATDEGLGIVWVGPIPRGPDRSGGTPLNADFGPGAGGALEQMLRDLAAESGYEEIAFAPLIPMGHSANGHFSWNVANWDASRVIAAIPIKTVPMPEALGFDGVPLCYLVGQTTEWPQYRVPDPATHPGDRDFFWPVVRDTAIHLRSANPRNLIGVVTDPGGGHFDWSANDARFVALYIRKACHFRLPGNGPLNQAVVLKAIAPESGWLTDTGGMGPDRFPPAPYRQYGGDPKRAYWFFDGETARAAAAFEGDRKPRARQMPTFVQDGHPLPVAKLGFAPLKFEPEADGLTFRVQGDFLPALPRELIGAGTPLGHAPEPIRFSAITGPVVQTGPAAFRIQFNRGDQGGPIWLLAENSGDESHRRAVQPGQLMIPPRLGQGLPQAITFPEIPNQPAGTVSVPLRASADSGLPVDYYVVAGPAEAKAGALALTPIPARSKYPVKVTVVAYQWGRTLPPLRQSALPVERTFLIER